MGTGNERSSLKLELKIHVKLKTESQSRHRTEHEKEQYIQQRGKIEIKIWHETRVTSRNTSET